MDLPEPGEPHEQHVVAPGGGYLQGPLYVFLAHDVGKVRQGLGTPASGSSGVWGRMGASPVRWATSWATFSTG